MEKKAELTSKYLVMIVLVVLGFGILLFFYYQISWKGIIDNQVCHQSVITRASASALTKGAAQELVPLKCRTEKICVTSRLFGGKCKEFSNLDEGVSKAKIRNKEQVERLIAKKIVECWDMMGQGKISVFQNYWLNKFGVGKAYSSCVICDRIAFDSKNLKKAKIDLSQINILNYMMTHKVPEKDKTYYEYLAGQSPIGISVEDKLNIKKDYGSSNTANLELSSLENLENTEDSDKELAILFMQISSPKGWDVFRNDISAVLGVTAGGTFLFGPKFITTAAKSVNWWTLSVAAIFGVYQQGNIAHNRAVTAGYCGDVLMGDGAKSGCSVVRTVNYNSQDISKYCKVIESLP